AELDSMKVGLLTRSCPPSGCLSTLSILDSTGALLMNIGTTSDTLLPTIQATARARSPGLLWAARRSQGPFGYSATMYGHNGEEITSISRSMGHVEDRAVKALPAPVSGSLI